MNHPPFLFQLLQGALIGLGAVLPGISGGVLSVVFGIYKPLMELISNPKSTLKTHLPVLFPYLLGSAVGFLGIANLLAFFLEKYPAPSVCLFIGLITGMLPSLLREAAKKGRNRNSCLSLLLSMTAVFLLLGFLKAAQLSIQPNFGWYLFCGFCLALSIIAPGMSFSTLLMPLELYTPFVDGIGHMNFSVLLPGGIGALLTLICLSKAVNFLLEHFYSVSFHAITGIVIAATVMILPAESFLSSPAQCFLNLACLFSGIFCALLLDRWNSKHEVA